jgi:hypothetical protein
MLCVGHGQSHPANAEDGRKLTMCEDGDIAVQRAETCDEAVGAAGNLASRFAARRTIAIDDPIRSISMDFGGGQAFVLAIVPLLQIRSHFDRATKPCKLTGASRPAQRARQHMPRSRGARAFASASPISVNGISVRPVC